MNKTYPIFKSPAEELVNGDTRTLEGITLKVTQVESQCAHFSLTGYASAVGARELAEIFTRIAVALED